jgi:hypothetical protein
MDNGKIIKNKVKDFFKFQKNSIIMEPLSNLSRKDTAKSHFQTETSTKDNT